MRLQVGLKLWPELQPRDSIRPRPRALSPDHVLDHVEVGGRVRRKIAFRPELFRQRERATYIRPC
jgi:hypothetical protein